MAASRCSDMSCLAVEVGYLYGGTAAIVIGVKAVKS
jgi:hypothetical protein